MTDFASDNDTEAAEMLVVASFPTEQEARDAAKLLVENGIGPAIGRGVPVGHEDPEPFDDPVKDRNTDEFAAAFEIRVMRHQVSSACDLLGVEAPEIPETEAVKPRRTPWKTIIIIWAIGMIVVPLAAFLLTYNLLK